MSRSYKKPFTKGRHSSWKWDRTNSSRKYRRFVQQKLHHEKYDDIHNRHKIFWDNWNWSPDYISYMGDYKHSVLGPFSIWYIEWRMRKGESYESIVENLIEERRQDYLKSIRK